MPIAVRYRVVGLLNDDAHTARFQTLAGRRPHAELAPFAPVSRASDGGIPVALPMAVASAIKNGPKTSGITERLGARDMGCVITTGSSSWYSSASGFSRRTGVRTMSKGRVAVPVVVTAAFAVLFFGLGSYLAARPSVDPQQELVALRADIRRTGGRLRSPEIHQLLQNPIYTASSTGWGNYIKASTSRSSRVTFCSGTGCVRRGQSSSPHKTPTRVCRARDLWAVRMRVHG